LRPGHAEVYGCPHPDSAKKVSVSIGLRDAPRRKILSGKDLAAESSQGRTYSG